MSELKTIRFVKSFNMVPVGAILTIPVALASLHIHIGRAVEVIEKKKTPKLEVKKSK